MEYRVDLYAAGEAFDRTERFIARNEPEALKTARGLVVALGLSHAEVYSTKGGGQLKHIATVGAEG